MSEHRLPLSEELLARSDRLSLHRAVLINRAWFAFCLGHEARQRIANRFGSKVDRDRTLGRILAEAVLSRERIKKMLVDRATQDATFNAETIEAQRKFKEHRKRWFEEMQRQNGGR